MTTTGSVPVTASGPADDAVDLAPLGHVPALDGLRAVAVAGVIVVHAGIDRALGAQHGVTVFFVLSGFLITTLLLQESAGTRRIDLPAFYRRRFARLMPAFLLVVAVTCGYLAITGHRWHEYWQGPVLSVLYVINVAAAHDALSTTAATYFTQNWSLALEEQFYLVWPVVVALLVGRRRGRRLLVATCIAAVVGSHATRIWLTLTGAPFERINFASETRVDAMMIGCLLALVLGTARGRALARRRTRLLLGVGLPVLLLVAVQGAVVRLDPGGYLAAALAAAGIVAALVHGRQGWVAAVLSSRFLTWVGRLSYGIYLWNVLLLEELVRQVGTDPVHTPWGVAWLLASVAAAQASYSWVEVPLRRRLTGRNHHGRAAPRSPAVAAAPES